MQIYNYIHNVSESYNVRLCTDTGYDDVFIHVSGCWNPDLRHQSPNQSAGFVGYGGVFYEIWVGFL